MTRRVIAGLVIACALVAAACSTDEPGKTGDRTPAVAAGAGDASAEQEQGVPPTPDAPTRAAYLRELRAIDVSIVGGKEDRAVDRGRTQCASIKQFPEDRAKLVALVNQRFTAPDQPDGFGPAKAAKILDVVHKYLCPSYPMATA